jgi:hypothetical protein
MVLALKSENSIFFKLEIQLKHRLNIWFLVGRASNNTNIEYIVTIFEILKPDLTLKI